MPRGGGGWNRKPDGQAVNRRGARRIDPRVLSVGRAEQPTLPGGYAWPHQTVEWWAMWGRSPLARDFTEGDWEELLSAAVYHAMVWDPASADSTRLKAGAELRHRMGAFGATPLGRQRLRIQLVMADEGEEKQAASRERRSSSRQRRGP